VSLAPYYKAGVSRSERGACMSRTTQLLQKNAVNHPRGLWDPDAKVSYDQAKIATKDAEESYKQKTRRRI